MGILKACVVLVRAMLVPKARLDVPDLLGVSVARLAEPAIGPRHRSTGGGHQMASQGIQAVLAVEFEARQAWTPPHRTRNP